MRRVIAARRRRHISISSSMSSSRESSSSLRMILVVSSPVARRGCTCCATPNSERRLSVQSTSRSLKRATSSSRSRALERSPTRCMSTHALARARVCASMRNPYLFSYLTARNMRVGSSMKLRLWRMCTPPRFKGNQDHRCAKLLMRTHPSLKLCPQPFCKLHAVTLHSNIDVRVWDIQQKITNKPAYEVCSGEVLRQGRGGTENRTKIGYLLQGLHLCPAQILLSPTVNG